MTHCTRLQVYGLSDWSHLFWTGYCNDIQFNLLTNDSSCQMLCSLTFSIHSQCSDLYFWLKDTGDITRHVITHQLTRHILLVEVTHESSETWLLCHLVTLRTPTVRTHRLGKSREFMEKQDDWLTKKIHLHCLGSAVMESVWTRTRGLRHDGRSLDRKWKPTPSKHEAVTLASRRRYYIDS
jgi:hypothetical protein